MSGSSFRCDSGQREKYEARVPGPDDLWMVLQEGGELDAGKVAGYGSEALRNLILLLEDALREVEAQEEQMEGRYERRLAIAREHAEETEDVLGKEPPP